MCDACTELDLSPQKFVIGQARQNSLPPNPHQFPVELGTSSLHKTSILNSGFDDRILGCLNEIEARASTCTFCHLISNTIHQYSNGDVNVQKPCRIRWEIDGHDVTAGPFSIRNRTRRIRLSWFEEATEPCHAYLIYVAPTTAQQPNSDTHALARRDRHFLARDPSHSKGIQALINSWINLCNENHGSSCQIAVGEFKDD